MHDVHSQQPKFDREQLHRRPEFEETKPNVHVSASASTSVSFTSSTAAGPSVKSEPAAAMPPPPNVPARTSLSVSSSEVRLNGGLAVRPSATSTPIVQRQAPPPATTVAQPTGLQTPVHTPGGRPAQTDGGDRMAQNLATRHAARLKQIQEAQEAQRREDAESAARAQSSTATHEAGPDAGERRVSFARAADIHTLAAGPGTTAQSRVSPPQVVPQSNDIAPDDEYHFPSEDDAFLASLDFDALDEDIGRPIDFEEGARPDIEDSMDVSTSGAGTGVGGPGVGGRDQQQQGPGATNVPTAAAANARSSHAAPPTRQGTSTSAVQGERARTPSMGGGFNFPSAAAGVSLQCHSFLMS